MGFLIEVKKIDGGFEAICRTSATTAIFKADRWESAFRMASSYASERMKTTFLMRTGQYMKAGKALESFIRSHLRDEANKAAEQYIREISR